jgi:hypothetical protein
MNRLTQTTSPQLLISLGHTQTSFTLEKKGILFMELSRNLQHDHQKVMNELVAEC